MILASQLYVSGLCKYKGVCMEDAKLYYVVEDLACLVTLDQADKIAKEAVDASGEVAIIMKATIAVRPVITEPQYEIAAL